mmetsp:Transcript_134679/g.430204  ORF Transcript_134679/g.430204 Transcript_134679/m.430204 type:complete len:576 (-) Transcript_134679:168-1895(-)
MPLNCEDVPEAQRGRPVLELPRGALQARQPPPSNGGFGDGSFGFLRRQGGSNACPRGSSGDTAVSPPAGPRLGGCRMMESHPPSTPPKQPIDDDCLCGADARSPFEGTPTDSTRSTCTPLSSPTLTPRQTRVCRYCLDGEESGGSECGSEPNPQSVSDDFVNPCPCRGSSKYVHLDCLVQHFVAQADWHNFRCPTCKQPYEGRALRELAELSRARMVKDHGHAAPQVAHSLCYLAQAHAQLGNVRESKELLEKGLAISEAHFGRGHVATAATLAELASAHGKMGDVKKQKELLERSLEIKEQHFGAGHINTAVTLNNLATAHSELGNVRQEKVLLERSLEIKEKHYGKGHVQTTAALVNLAGVYSELGDVAKGLQLLEWSLEIEERHFGTGHVETAITLNNLALACGEGGDMQRMRELLLRSLKIKEMHFGPDHQELCLTLANLGMACSALGQLADSKMFCNRALAICAEPEARSSRRHGVVLLRTASVQMALNQDLSAAELTTRAVQTLRKALGVPASSRVLGLECTRMSRIWTAVGREDVVQQLQHLKTNCVQREGLENDANIGDSHCRTVSI